MHWLSNDRHPSPYRAGLSWVQLCLLWNSQTRAFQIAGLFGSGTRWARSPDSLFQPPFFQLNEWLCLPGVSGSSWNGCPDLCEFLCWDLPRRLKQPCWKLVGLFCSGISWSVGSKNSFGNAVIAHPLHFLCELQSRAVPIGPSCIVPLVVPYTF